MNQKLKEKIQESLSAVLPITGIVMLQRSDGYAGSRRGG